jgi:hypothetical protein
MKKCVPKNGYYLKSVFKINETWSSFPDAFGQKTGQIFAGNGLRKPCRHA